MITQVEGVIILICLFILACILQRNSADIREAWWHYKCSKGHHRLHETVGNRATGMPSTGYMCYECGKKWDWEGNERVADGTDL